MSKHDKKEKKCKDKKCPDDHKKDHCIRDGEPFEHQILLYVGDAYGAPVPKTEFWIMLIIIKDGAKVTIQIPFINFQTGQFANIPEEDGLLPPPNNGGYVYTLKGNLPKKIRPNSSINMTYFAGSNNGYNQTFTFNGLITDTPPIPITFTPPQAGYLLQISNSGALTILGIGTLGNIILPGNQNVLPTAFTYIVQPHFGLSDNTQISTGAINTAVFPPDSDGFDFGVRDFHLNDAYKGTVAFTWPDNSTQLDRNPNIMNTAVSTGMLIDGKLKLRAPFLFPNPDGFYSVDSGVAISRLDNNNIVVSWEYADTVDFGSNIPLFRAVSTDGGQNWISGPSTDQPDGIISFAGDNLGVKCDKFGNFWWISTSLFDNEGNIVNNPFISISTNGGVTFTRAFTFPVANPNDQYDSPTHCFGGDGLGNYGVHIIADLFPNEAIGAINGFPVVAFIPVTALGAFGPIQILSLPQFQNADFTNSITASEDGRVWTHGSPEGLGPALYPFPGGAITNNSRMIFKSPGALGDNYAGPFEVAMFNQLFDSLFVLGFDAQPSDGFFISTQTNFFDDKRQALYIVVNVKFPDESQDCRLYLIASRNNGLTFSNPFEISTTVKNNRGFASMALDVVTEDLIIGWYDGRNFEDKQSLQYFGAVVTAKELDRIVAQLPRSDPRYNIPNPNIPNPNLPTPNAASAAASSENAAPKVTSISATTVIVIPKVTSVVSKAASSNKSITKEMKEAAKRYFSRRQNRKSKAPVAKK